MSNKDTPHIQKIPSFSRLGTKVSPVSYYPPIKITRRVTTVGCRRSEVPPCRRVKVDRAEEGVAITGPRNGAGEQVFRA